MPDGPPADRRSGLEDQVARWGDRTGHPVLIWFLAAVYIALISVAVLVFLVVMLRRTLTAGDASAAVVIVAALGAAALAQLVWFPTRLIRRGLAERRARLATPGP